MKPSGAVAVVAALVVASCSGPSKVVLGSGEPRESAAGGQGGELNAGGASGFAGALPAAGGVSPTSRAAGGIMIFPPGAASAGGADTCTRIISKPEMMPHDTYLMVDRSEWMNTPLPGSPGGTYWSEIVRGLTLFLNDPALGGVGVGLQFFPRVDAPQPSCSADYATPEVEIDDRRGNRAALDRALSARSPRGPRPTGVALVGAMAHMKAWAGEHASGAASAATVVLVTSGPPDACSPGDAQGMANVAQEGLESAPSVRTHIVAMSPEAMAADWDIVSLSGGTNPAWSDADADADANPGAMLHGALRRLFLSPVECAYVLPTTGSGDDWSDQSRVAVTYTSTAGTFQVPLVPLTHDCGPDGGFYLVPAAPNSSPARIEFCPSTCVAVQGGEVELAYACPRGPVPTG